MSDIEKAFEKYGPGSEAAVRRMAKKHNIPEKDAIKYFNEHGAKPDARKGKLYKQGSSFGLPIFSQRPGGWQFDTVCPSKNGEHFLWFVNVNTKETRAYSMKDKSSESVQHAMKKFLLDTKNNKKNPREVSQLISDRDPAYMTDEMLNFYRDNGIDYRTTTGTSKHVLGIVNRNIRMIRNRIANTGDLVDENGVKGTSGNMTTEEVNKKISGWNTDKNENLGGHTPRELTNKDNKKLELDYIANKMNLADAKRKAAFKGVEEGMKVRRFRIGEKGHAEGNLDPYAWTIHHIDKLRGSVYLGRDDAKEGLVQVPRFQIDIDQSKQRGFKKNPPLEELAKKPTKILKQKGGKYEIEYEDGSKGTMTNRQLRGDRPLRETQLEKDYQNTLEKSRTTTMITRKRKRELGN
jgi:hypothetical protein